MRTSVFHGFGCFPATPLMEDFEFVRQVAKSGGSIVILDLPVITSARRWQKLGYVKTLVLNQLVIIGYLSGIAPQLLHEWYY